MHVQKTFPSPDTTNTGLSLFKKKKKVLILNSVSFSQYLPLGFSNLSHHKLTEMGVRWFFLWVFFWGGAIYHKYPRIWKEELEKYWHLLSKSWSQMLHLAKSCKLSGVQYYPLWKQQLESWLRCSQWKSCFWFLGTRMHNESLSVNLCRPWSKKIYMEGCATLRKS